MTVEELINELQGGLLPPYELYSGDLEVHLEVDGIYKPAQGISFEKDSKGNKRIIISDFPDTEQDAKM